MTHNTVIRHMRNFFCIFSGKQFKIWTPQSPFDGLWLTPWSYFFGLRPSSKFLNKIRLFGCRLCFRLQARKAPSLLHCLDRAVLTPWAENSSSRSIRLGDAIYLKTEAEQAAETSCFITKLDDRRSPTREDYVSEFIISLPHLNQCCMNKCILFELQNFSSSINIWWKFLYCWWFIISVSSSVYAHAINRNSFLGTSERWLHFRSKRSYYQYRHDPIYDLWSHKQLFIRPPPVVSCSCLLLPVRYEPHFYCLLVAPDARR